MKVFISWSGSVSNEVAKLLANWLPDVIQGTEVFLSSQDIAKGERNAKSMWDALDDYEFGLSIVTAQNKTAPWIMFEAGAMMRFHTARVVPILCNLDRLDITSTPLNSFQCSTLGKDDMLAVVKSMNEAAGMPLTPDKLVRSFDRWWPELEAQINAIDMTKGLEKTDKPLDNVEHFKRIENGMTAIMNMVDRLHKDAAQDRAQRNHVSDYPMKKLGVHESPLMKWNKLINLTNRIELTPEELEILSEAMAESQKRDTNKDNP